MSVAKFEGTTRITSDEADLYLLSMVGKLEKLGELTLDEAVRPGTILQSHGEIIRTTNVGYVGQIAVAPNML